MHCATCPGFAPETSKVLAPGGRLVVTSVAVASSATPAIDYRFGLPNVFDVIPSR